MIEPTSNFHDFIFHGVVDGVHAAEFRADLASAGFKMHANVPVDGRGVGHGLGIGTYTGFRPLRPMSYSEGINWTPSAGDLGWLIFSRVMWPVGQTEAQAPQAMQTSV
jgi:hypothetical protein